MRRGFSLIEGLLSILILAVTGLGVYELLIQSTRGVAVDRLTEVKRHLILDLLERYCQPYSEVPALFHGKPPPYLRQLSLDEVFEIVAIPAAEAAELKATLVNGKDEGFSLAWTPRLEAGRGDVNGALRLDGLWCTAVVAGDSPGPRVQAFRVFAARGKAGE